MIEKCLYSLSRSECESVQESLGGPDQQGQQVSRWNGTWPAAYLVLHVPRWLGLVFVPTYGGGVLFLQEENWKVLLSMRTTLHSHPALLLPQDRSILWSRIHCPMLLPHTGQSHPMVQDTLPCATTTYRTVTSYSQGYTALCHYHSGRKWCYRGTN